MHLFEKVIVLINFYRINVMRIFTVFISIFSILATALPLIQSAQWWIRIFDYPRLQIAFLGLIAITLNIFYFRFKKTFSNVITGLLFIALVYQLTLIIKYTPLYPIQAEAVLREQRTHPFSIMQSNVKMDNRNADKFLDLVYQKTPDIVIVNEPDLQTLVWYD